MKLSILYDNRALPGYRADWGFACLVEGKERVLFDTGADATVLEHNMKRAGIEPSSLDKLVLSHHHWDHTGGLSYVNEAAPGLPVLALPSFAEQMKDAAPALAVEQVLEAGEIAPGVYTTGQVERGIAPEQAIGLRTEDGIVMVCGCAHPGVDALMEAISSFGPVCGVLGGFHDFDKLDALAGLSLLGACHCTKHRKEIAARFPDAYTDIMAGTVLELP